VTATPHTNAKLRILAAPGALPAVFHCAAGKDRTGVVTALALGATRWEMLRMAVLPYSRPGITGAAIAWMVSIVVSNVAMALTPISRARILRIPMGETR